MSHTVTNGEWKISRPELAKALAESKGWTVGYGNTRFYTSNHTGTLIQIPGWRYPFCIQADGTIAYDNYNGQWGNLKDLQGFVHEYGLAYAQQQAMLHGFAFQSQTLPNGTVLFACEKDEGTIHGEIKDGKLSYHVEGVQGAGCLQFAEFLSSATTGSVQMTQDQYEKPEQIQQQQLEGA